MTRPGAPPATPPTAEVVDSRSARVHRPLDLIRLGTLVVALLLLTALAVVARDTSSGAATDLARLLSHVPPVFVQLLRIVAAAAALAVPLALIAREALWGHRRRLGEAVLTGLLGIGIAEALDRVVDAFPSSALHTALTTTSGGATAQPLDTYLVGLFAFAAVIGVAERPRWRTLLRVVTAGYVVSAFLAGQASLESLVISPVVGLVVGLAVRYLAGSVDERPGGARIAAELARRGIGLVRLEATVTEPDRLREYRATTGTGAELLVQAFDRDVIASGAIYNLYRILRLRADLAPAPALSLERVTEHRTLLAMATQAAGVLAPRLLAGVPVGPDTIVLAYESVAGVPLEEPTDGQLDELWRSVNRLHAHRVTHRGLTAGKILLGPDGRVVLPIPVSGALFARDLRVNLDRVQLLITTAQLAGAERAVRAARRSLTDDEVAAVLPVLQPIALPDATRRAVKEHVGLLDAVRDEIQSQTDHRPPPLANVERMRPRVIVSIAAVLVAGYLVVGQLTSVDLATVFSRARWQWVPLVLLASALTYLAAALSLTGYVRETLSFPRTLLAQLAASFTGFVTPPAVGGLALNARYLQKAGVSPAGVATGLGLSQALNAASHVVLLFGFAAATGATTGRGLHVPGWGFGILAAVAGFFLLALAVPGVRHWLSVRLLPPLREAMSRLLDLITTPQKLTQALVGGLALNAAYIAALWFAVQAFNGQVGAAGVAVVYLAGAAVGSASPTPGGLGAVEVAMSTGLAALGMAGTVAVSAVLLFRLATFWLPVPVGWIALQWLRRLDAV